MTLQSIPAPLPPEFRRDVRMSEAVAKEELTQYHAQALAARAIRARDSANCAWTAARRRALAAFRAYNANRFLPPSEADDGDLHERFSEEWECCKAAYKTAILARRTAALTRELADAADASFHHARARVESSANRGDYD